MCKNKEPRRKLIAPEVVLVLILLGLPNLLMADCAADITRDGRIDGLDFAIMRTEMGRKDCFTAHCKSDLDRDGEVSGKDRKILQSELGRRDCLAESMEMPEAGSAALRVAPDETDLLDESPEEVQASIKEAITEETADDVRGEAEEEVKPSDASDEEHVSALKKKKRNNTRFKDNEDGTVSDPKSGLMWTRDANLPGEKVLFYEALDFIEEMNRGNIPNFGYTDWRLPTLQELRSLKDFTNYTRGMKDQLPEGHPFENLQWLSYETYYAYPTYLWTTKLSWFASAYCRLVGRNTGTCVGFVWPVRGGKRD